MKTIFIVLLSLFTLPAFPQDQPTKELELQSNDCSIRVILSQSKIFWNQRDSQNWCNGIYQQFGFSKGCFVQGFKDGSWLGSFQHRVAFSGRNYRNDFNTWLNPRTFRGQAVEVRLQFGNSCSHRNGGGNYPLD